MTYLFQTLDRTAVKETRGLEVQHKKLPPIINTQRVPEHKACVAHKLRECQALGPRIARLERQLEEKQRKALEQDTSQMSMQEAGMTKNEINQRLKEARTTDLRNKQQLVDKQRKEKELARIQMYMAAEDKKAKIIQEKANSDVAKLKDQRTQEYFQKQEVVREFRQRQQQKMADVKAIKDYQSRKIVAERKQQRKYELLLEQELEEELTQIKQRENELKAQLNNQFFMQNSQSMDTNTNYGDTTMNTDQPTQYMTQNGSLMQGYGRAGAQEDAQPRVKSSDILRSQMIQERMK